MHVQHHVLPPACNEVVACSAPTHAPDPKAAAVIKYQVLMHLQQRSPARGTRNRFKKFMKLVYGRNMQGLI
jgi:hypothetical protein